MPGTPSWHVREALLKQRHNNDEGQQNERAAHAFSKLQQGYQHALIRVMSPSHVHLIAVLALISAVSSCSLEWQ